MDDSQLINNLNKLKHRPSHDWHERTRARLEVLTSETSEALSTASEVDDANQVVTTPGNLRTPLHTLLFSFQFMQRKTLFIGGTLSAIALLGGGLLLANIISRNVRTEQAVTLTAEQQQQILAQVLRNNSQASLASLNQTSVAAESDGATISGRKMNSADYSILPVDPGIGGGIWQPDYKFRESTSTMTIGPAQSRCAGYGTNLAGTTSSADYYGEDGYVYSKYSQKDADGNLLYYSLSKPENDRNAYYDYRGGDYAVRNLYELSPILYGRGAETMMTEGAVVDSATSSDIVAADPTATDIANYFGPDAKITKEITEGGRKYYEIEYSWDINCNDAGGGIRPLYISAVGGAGEPTNKIINTQVVSADTFEVTEYRAYLDSVDANNLITTTTSQVVVNNNDLSTVAGKFDFEYSVPVRDLDWEVLGAQQQAEQESKAINYVSSNSIYLPVNVQDGYTNSISINLEYTPVAGGDYAQDRSFYPAGAVGDRMYAEMNPVIDAGQVYPNPSIYTSYNDSSYNNSVSASIYEASKYTLGQISATYAQGEHVSVVETPVTINVGGHQVSGTKYTVTDNSSVAYAELYPAPDYQPTPYVYEQVLFTLGSYHYQLNQYSFDATTNISSQSFAAGEITVPSLFTGNAGELAQVLSIVEQGYQAIAVDAATERALY